MSNDDHFEVGESRELRERHGLNAENRPPIRLDPSRVPEKFRRWIPLAERWGIADDLTREDCVSKASTGELQDLLAFRNAYDEVLAQWLSGPESESPRPTPEYVAFSALGFALDEAVFRSERDQTRDPSGT